MVQSFYLSILIFALFVLYPASVWATDKGVIAIPKDMDNLTVENFIDTIKISAEMSSNATLGAPNWREMEPSPGNFDLDHPVGGFVYATQQGMSRLYLNLQIINTVKREVPADLMEMAWDDPVMLQRFDALIAAIKALGKVNPLSISIGNEADVYFASHRDELRAYLVFLKSARSIVRKYYPDMPVGVTVTFDGMQTGRGDIITQLTKASDIVYVTYYPVVNFKPLPVSDAPKHLEIIKKFAGNKTIIIQEFGFPSSSDLLLGENGQAEFYKKALPVFLNDKQIAALFVFALHDISPKLCDKLTGYYGANAWPAPLMQNFRAFLCSLGLIDFNGRMKPAFNSVKSIFEQY